VDAKAKGSEIGSALEEGLRAILGGKGPRFEADLRHRTEGLARLVSGTLETIQVSETKQAANKALAHARAFLVTWSPEATAWAQERCDESEKKKVAEAVALAGGEAARVVDEAYTAKVDEFDRKADQPAA
jgi:hypothetical protein